MNVRREPFLLAVAVPPRPLLLRFPLASALAPRAAQHLCAFGARLLRRPRAALGGEARSSGRSMDPQQEVGEARARGDRAKQLSLRRPLFCLGRRLPQRNPSLVGVSRQVRVEGSADWKRGSGVFTVGGLGAGWVSDILVCRQVRGLGCAVWSGLSRPYKGTPNAVLGLR